MGIRFILYIALRYIRARRKSKKTASSFLSIGGIAIGVMTLTVVIGVMNGFQLGFIEPLINIASYHIQIKSRAPLDPAILSRIGKVADVVSIVPFTETQAILGGNIVSIIRGLPPDVNELDPLFKESFYSRRYDKPDEKNLSRTDGILIGSELALRLGVIEGDRIAVTTFNGKPYSMLEVTGIFKTWYLDIDSNWAFTSLQTLKSLRSLGEADDITYGIKVRDRFSEGAARKAILAILAGTEDRVKSWREYDPAFFNTLLMEKVMMMVLIGLIFIVVGFNIYHSQKRTVLEKKEEIGILRAIGATPVAVQNIFLLEGFIIGILGSIVGIVLGLFLSNNVNELFRTVEYIVNNLILSNLKSLLSPFIPGLRFGRILIFSPDVFYIDKIHTRVFLPEVLFMCITAISSSTFAALFASVKISEIKPREVLRYE
jgi:lipoprotein-releasing system permease protein